LLQCGIDDAIDVESPVNFPKSRSTKAPCHECHALIWCTVQRRISRLRNDLLCVEWDVKLY